MEAAAELAPGDWGRRKPRSGKDVEAKEDGAGEVGRLPVGSLPSDLSC